MNHDRFKEIISKNSATCAVCHGYNYELIGCCSGHQCACDGWPIVSKPCGECNNDSKKKPSSQAKKDWPHIFLNREEWDKYFVDNY